MPEAARLTASPPPSGAEALACCRARLAATEQRLAALTETCLRPCRSLLADLDRLPTAARFEPFPAEATPPVPVGAASGRESARGRRTPGQEAGSARTAPGENAFAAGNPPAPPPAQARRTAPIAAGGRSHGSAAPAEDSRLAQTGSAGAATPASFGAAVAALLARWPDAPGNAPARPATPAAPAAASLADTPLGPIIQNLVTQSTGRPGPRQSAPARQFARLPTQLGAATAAAVAEWLASQAPAPASRQGGLAAALAGQAPSLLAQLVAGLDPAEAKANDAAAPAAPRQAAPRARSRLNEAAAPEANARPAHDAPAATSLPGQEASELAKQLNRLLLDQAWLRGVDLT